ncbi:YihY/virulence factor BrkB family protein [Kamptonema sp. UHCC 0994]|uniref:YihY/virulence factor BrkB family protein n=1 Tax=Kamptonema sp. UHCC 0994 TaxID=3031329 RepID=UPI0023B8B3BA|nr:YihY/virulence factor BrkB family protein [Kamptonema sp. UHCC 0994]MDF0555335.1 YihY/virulence factor BrkB family protein [Kamptonema sp. UHCC 0994]
MNIFRNLRHLILAMFQVLWMLLRRIIRRSRRFFNFFGHLNWTIIKEVGDRAGQQRLPGLSAEMAYNAMLALFPALLASIAAIALFESLQSTLYQMAQLLGEIVPNQVRTLIRSLIQEILQTRNQEIFSVSFIGALWAFSGVLSAAMAALDQIHQIPTAQTRPFWKAKLVSIALSIGTIMLLILACGVVFVSDLIVQVVARQSCLLEAVSNCELQDVYNCQLLPIQSCPLESHLLAIWKLWRWPITLGIVSSAFAFIYRYGPSRHHRGTPILPGAILAAIFWAGISGLLRFYVSHFANYNWTYGTIGTFIILLLWLNFSSLVMLLGAQLNVTVGKAMKGNC